MTTSPLPAVSAADPGRGAVRPVPRRTVPDLLAARVRATPSDLALLADDARLTYAELDSAANRLAHLLIGLGAGPERVVGVALPRSVPAVVAMLAVVKTGAVHLPLNPAYPAERTAFMLADADPIAVVTDAATAAALPAPPPGRLLLWSELDLAGRPDHAPTDADRTAPLRPEHPLYLIYTSGSTGVPKGVLMPTAGLVNLLAWHGEHLPIGPAIRTAQLTALAFDMSQHEILSTLVHGRCLVIPDEALRLDAVRLAHWLDRHRVNQVFLPTVLIDALCDAAEAAGIALEALTDVIQSGEPLVLSDRIRRFLEQHPGLTIRNHYGASEMQDVTVWSAPARAAAGAAEPPTVGRPLWNTRIHVLDDELRPVPNGVPGDLYVAGAGLARGYLNRPGLTAQRFVPDPAGRPGERMYRTGDVARWTADGELQCLGRSDNQVKVNGVRVELGEIEARLTERADVAQALVLPRELARGGRRLVAYVTPARGAEPSPDGIRAELARALPAAMVPAAVLVLPELPLAPNGKVALRDLPLPETAAPASGLPADEDESGDQTAEDPGGGRAGFLTTAETAMVEAFHTVLGGGPVGADDDFFALGGDSVAAIRLAAAARRAGLAVAAADVFELPTPRRLAARAEPVRASSGTRPAGTPLVALTSKQLALVQAACPDVERILPVAPLQQGFLFHGLRGGDAPDVHTEQLVLRLAGAGDGAGLRRAAAELLARHEALRAGFVVAGLAEPVQFVAPAADPAWRAVDLSGADPQEAERRAERLVAAERRARFDPRHPPLIRFALIRLPGDLALLAVTYHHILLDGWSATVLVDELVGPAVPVPVAGRDTDPVPTPQYHSWLRWLRSRDRAAAAEAWRAALTGIAAPTVLAPGGAGTPPPGSRRFAVAVGPDVVGPLLDFARGHGLTLNTLVQTAWGLVLAAETGAAHAVFGTAVSGRTPEVAGADRMIGLLMNMVPTAVRIRPGDRVADVARRLQADQVALAPHQHLGLGAVQRAAGWDDEADTVLVFENPETQVRTGRAVGPDAGPRVVEAAFHDETLYAVSIIATPGAGGLRLSVTYRPDLLTTERVRGLIGRLSAVLEAVAGDPWRQAAEVAGPVGGPGR